MKNNINITKLAQNIWYGDNTYKPEGVSAGRWRAAIASAKSWIEDRTTE